MRGFHASHPPLNASRMILRLLLLLLVSEVFIPPLIPIVTAASSSFRNPPFPFTSYSEEAFSSDSDYSSTGGGDNNDATTTFDPNDLPFPTDFPPLQQYKLKFNSSISPSEDISPTGPSAPSSSMETQTLSSSSSHTRLLTTSTTPFSIILANKTMGRTRSNIINSNTLKNLRANSSSSVSPMTIEMETTTSSRPQPRGPTSAVIQSSSYNRVVKRRKITSISGINKNGSGNVELSTTGASATEDEADVPTTMSSVINSSHFVGAHIGNGSSSSVSRSIAGFSGSPKVSSAIKVTKSRPKPIIIRDHDAFLRNESTSPSPSPEVTTTSSVDDEEEERTTTTHLNGLPHGHGHPYKVRKVKVTMRRPGPGVTGTVTSDFPIESVTTTVESIVLNTTLTPHPHHNIHNQSISMAAASEHMRIHPSPSSGYREEPTVSSRKVYKEDFVISGDSYDDHTDDHHGDDDPTTGSDSDERFHSTMHHQDHSHGDDMDVDATTEHYSSLIPMSPSPWTPHLSTNIESSMAPHDEANQAANPTPGYRDYFAEIQRPVAAPGVQNHIDQFPSLPSTTPSSVTITVTKTVQAPLATIGPSPAKPEDQIPIPFNVIHDIPSPSRTPLPPTASTALSSTTTTEKSDVVNNPPVTNSVEEVNVTDHRHGGVTNSKESIGIYVTKVDVGPHFSSSSYESTTSYSYSYNNSSGHPHEDHDHADTDHPHGDDDHDFDHSHEPDHHDHDHGNSEMNKITDFKTGANATSAESTITPVLISKPYENVANNVSSTPVSPTVATSSSTTTTTIGTTATTSTTVSSTSTTTSSSTTMSSKVKGQRPHKSGPFPAMYQVPVLVKMELEIGREMFCSQLHTFKDMIVEIYAQKQPQELGISVDQIMMFTEPNCSSITAFDFVPTDPSAPLHTSPKDKLTTKPTSATTTKRIPTEVTKPIETPVTKQGRRRRRRQVATNSPKGESLILDNKLRDGGREEVHSSTNIVTFPGDDVRKGEDDGISVYFFLNDKKGVYDQELTMAFFTFWNESKANLNNENASFIQGVFYQRVRKVDMISASGLTSTTAGENDAGNENSGIIMAIAIASIAATCLFLIGVLLLVLRHRQAQTKFAKRCTPVTLDDFSLDNISFSNSFRRKQRLRGSKRSYTNAAFDDHSAPTRVVEPSTLHAALTDGSGLEAEFRGIPNQSPTLDDIPQGAETKNRYANVIPMPDSRVLLTFQEEQPNSDYINANFVRGANGEPKRYIITQGPLEETIVDFWRMVWEQQVRVIFMLTDFSEGGIPKCGEYYPRSETIDCSQLHGDFQVTLEKRDMTEHCVTSYLVVKDMERNLRRDVVHLWYHSWPERGVPSLGKPTVDFLLKSRKFTKEITPILVHCSPGTGRSGTLVACDVAMREFEKVRRVDIPRLLLRIRQDRAGCVQTKEQYLHIYETLHFYATRYLESVSPDSIP